VKIGSFFIAQKYSKNNQKIFKKVLTRRILCVIMVAPKQKKGEKMTVQELAEKANVTERRVYQLAKKLGRLPTVAEIEERKGKRGRPQKYKWEADNE
jgi:DNA-directed RNA polymerase sigma subunit (sigma70/sigma32)